MNFVSAIVNTLIISEFLISFRKGRLWLKSCTVPSPFETGIEKAHLLFRGALSAEKLAGAANRT